MANSNYRRIATKRMITATNRYHNDIPEIVTVWGGDEKPPTHRLTKATTEAAVAGRQRQQRKDEEKERDT